MGVDTAVPEAADDPFAESDEWLAAQVRQIFRARQARDLVATEVAIFYFLQYLSLTVQRQLRLHHEAWDCSRWFDDLNVEPEYPASGRLRLQGEVCWVVGQETWYYDPFSFEIELCPESGAFRRYVVRFGDHRPLSAKVSGSAVAGVPFGEWAFTIERTKERVVAETASATDAAN